jgi:tRNA threonylcarbamoyladenosine biosynthesis protein TsaB
MLRFTGRRHLTAWGAFVTGSVNFGVLLGIDTCGATGSVALARIGLAQPGVVKPEPGEPEFEGLNQTEIPGGEFATRLVTEIAALLDKAGLTLQGLAGIVVTSGPGSFTGIRIGLSAAKAMAEAAGLPVVAVSRLAVLAAVAATRRSALDAHRGQVFLGAFDEGKPAHELLVTAGEFSADGGLRVPGAVAFCEEAVAQLLDTVADLELARTRPPTSLDAIGFSLPRWMAGDFDDVAALDGHYLRGADAKTQAALASARS